MLALLALLPMAGLAADPFLVGACTHFGQGKGLLGANLSVMSQGGIAFFRDEVGWGAIERTRREFVMPTAWDEFVNAGLKAGIEPLIILDYGNRLYDDGDKPRSPEAIEAFCRYAEFVVGHFKGRVKLYEVPGTLECARWYKTLLEKLYGEVPTKYFESYISLSVGGTARVWITRRKNDRAFIEMKHGEENFQEAVDYLNKEGVSFGVRGGKFLTFNVNAKQLKDRAPIYEWLALRLSPENPKNSG
jgi:hypothetical protein